MKLWVGDFTANGRGDVIRTGVNATYELDLFLQEADGSMTHVRRDFPESGVVPAGDMVVPAGILDVMADGRPAVFAGGVFTGGVFAGCLGVYVCNDLAFNEAYCKAARTVSAELSLIGSTRRISGPASRASARVPPCMDGSSPVVQ